MLIWIILIVVLFGLGYAVLTVVEEKRHHQRKLDIIQQKLAKKNASKHENQGQT